MYFCTSYKILFYDLHHYMSDASIHTYIIYILFAVISGYIPVHKYYLILPLSLQCRVRRELHFLR